MAWHLARTELNPCPVLLPGASVPGSLCSSYQAWEPICVPCLRANSSQLIPRSGKGASPRPGVQGRSGLPLFGACLTTLARREGRKGQ